MLVLGALGQPTNSGFIVYGGLLIDGRHVESLARTAADELTDREILDLAAAHDGRLVANLILGAIALPNQHDFESGARTVMSRASNIAGQWRRPLLTTWPVTSLVPLATRMVAILARGIGALEGGRVDADLAAVMGLFPVAASTGRRNHAALTTRPVKISVTQYRNRYHRLMKAINAVG